MLLPPLFSFYIFQNMNSGTYSDLSNVVLVVLTIAMSLIKPILRVCAEDKLRKIGREMHSMLSRAVLTKTFNVSLLSNNRVTGSELLKVMQVDVEKVIGLPELQSFLFANLCGTITNILIIIFLFGWAGVLGIVVFLSTLSVRFILKNKLNAYDERTAKERGSRIRQTMDIFNIIKFIKVAALELSYYRKLVDLRVSEVDALHSKNTFELIPLFIGSISVRMAMLTILWVTILMGRQFDSAVIFTVMYVFGNLNFYSLIRALTNLNQTKISLKAIDAFLRAQEMDNNHINRSLMPTDETIVVENGNFYWELKPEENKQLIQDKSEPQRV